MLSPAGCLFIVEIDCWLARLAYLPLCAAAEQEQANHGDTVPGAVKQD